MKNAAYRFEATTDLPGVSFNAMRQMIMMQVKSGGLTVLEDEDRQFTVETAHGLVGLRSGVNAETAGYVGAADEHWLFVMKTAVIAQMQHVMPEVALAMRWSNGPEEGALPPNFAFVQVREVVELGPNFLRVYLQGEDLSKHRDDAIHFRLVVPPEGNAPRPTGPSSGRRVSMLRTGRFTRRAASITGKTRSSWMFTSTKAAASPSGRGDTSARTGRAGWSDCWGRRAAAF